LWRDGSGRDRFHRKFLAGTSESAFRLRASHDQACHDFAISNPDAAYGNLLAARRGLSEADAAAFDARLVLILANQIGDLDVLEEGTLARSAGQRG
jgi:hypothetical protein